MRRSWVLMAVGLSALISGGAGGAAATGSPPFPSTLVDGLEAEYVPGELLVRFRAAVGAGRRARVLQEAGVRHDGRIPGGAFRVRVRAGESAPDPIAALEPPPRVLYSRPNHV